MPGIVKEAIASKYPGGNEAFRRRFSIGDPDRAHQEDAELFGTTAMNTAPWWSDKGNQRTQEELQHPRAPSPLSHTSIATTSLRIASSRTTSSSLPIDLSPTPFPPNAVLTYNGHPRVRPPTVLDPPFAALRAYACGDRTLCIGVDAHTGMRQGRTPNDGDRRTTVGHGPVTVHHQPNGVTAHGPGTAHMRLVRGRALPRMEQHTRFRTSRER
jgi:hypothetical protein